MSQGVRIAITLTILVVLSGCSGLVPGDGSAAGSPTPTGSQSYEQVVENHSESLRDAGQFKVRWVRSVQFPDRVVNGSPGSNEVVVDLGSEQYLVGEDLEGHNGIYQSGSLYQNGPTTWQRTELENGSTVYRRVSPDNPFSARNLTRQEIWALENRSKQFPLERNGTAIFQGQRVTRYTADELGTAERCLFISGYVIEHVTSVDVVALVDNRGIIRKFQCELSGETNLGERFTERRLWTVTGIGTVEIRAPSPLVNGTRGG